jgi:osmotically-inducible protein OsmY
MKKAVLVPVFVIFGLTVCAGFATVKAETPGEYNDSTITSQVIGIIANDPDAQYFKIDVTTIQGDVELQGFVNDRETEDRLVVKIKQIRGVKSVNSLLRLQ